MRIRLRFILIMGEFSLFLLESGIEGVGLLTDGREGRRILIRRRRGGLGGLEGGGRSLLGGREVDSSLRVNW